MNSLVSSSSQCLQFGSFVFQGLYLGSIGAANSKDELQRLNITHVLVVGKSLGAAYPSDFVYKCIEGTALSLCLSHFTSTWRLRFVYHCI